MKAPTLLLTVSAILFGFVSTAASAREYNLSNLPYSDKPSDRSTALAISTLTAAGVLQGDPGGTIRPQSELNRAEFMKIVMSLLSLNGTEPSYDRTCFPDVKVGSWYAPYVCRAKAMGIVTGHAKVGVPEAQWLFKPDDAVQYEEAVKVLASMYALSLDGQGGTWYDPYLRAAQLNDVAISGLRPGDHIKRGEMARLVVRFIAFNEGELDILRDAERGIIRSSSVSSSSDSSSSGAYVSSAASSLSSRSSASSSVSSGTWKGGYDPNSDTMIRSQVITLGSSSVILGAVNLFSNNEPLDVTKLRITLVGSTSTLDSLLMYDKDRRYLGRATLDTSVSGEKQYLVNLPQGTLVLPKRENVTIYARAVLKNHDQGGESNESIQIASIGIEGNGQWSSDDYNQTYTDTFPVFSTARARIVKVENAGAQTANFVASSNQRLASFRFIGEGDDQGMNNLRTTSLTFQIDAPSGVTLSNVYLKREGGDEQSTCSVSSGIVTCISIPASIGSVKGDSVIHVYGNVAVAGVNDPTLRLTLNNAGGSSGGGSVTWADGDATFSWVPTDSPVARGTMFQ